MLLVLAACTALTGLETLEQLPPSFPLAIEGELGVITSPGGSDLVSVDVAYDTPEKARAAWSALQDQAETKGFAVVGEGMQAKRETITLQATTGRLELGCCRPRADRQHLVFVKWVPSGE